MTKRYKFFHSKTFLAAKIFFLAAFPLTLVVLPKTAFDNHEHTICIFSLLSGIECYGCGLTRACMRLIHLDFYGAGEFNSIAYIVFPILCLLYLKEFLDTVTKMRSHFKSPYTDVR